MTKRIVLWGAPIFLLCIITACGTTQDQEALDAAALPETIQAQEVDVDTFNTIFQEHRLDVGCNTLEWMPELADLALAHSKDMVERNYFAHQNPEGQNVWDRADQANITYMGIGENLAFGTTDGAQVFQMWFDSSGHRANMEKCSYTHHGIGLFNAMWTHVFLTKP